MRWPKHRWSVLKAWVATREYSRGSFSGHELLRVAVCQLLRINDTWSVISFYDSSGFNSYRAKIFGEIVLGIFFANLAGRTGTLAAKFLALTVVHQ